LAGGADPTLEESNMTQEEKQRSIAAGSNGNEKLRREHLATYLNDHFAGSTTLLQLLQHLSRSRSADGLAEFFVTLRGDVVADRVTLEGIMQRLHVQQHRRRTATAWLIEKLGRFKLKVDDAGDGSLHLLEALEIVQLGIEGKRELWKSLAAASERVPGLHGINFDYLAERAQKQHDRVEAVRVETAKRTLAGGLNGNDSEKAGVQVRRE
jgi:hypothetical protein